MMKTTKKNINRENVIQLLVLIQLLKLSLEDKEYFLYLHFSKEDGFNEDEFENNISSFISNVEVSHNDIYIFYLKEKYIGVKNQYLEKQLYEYLRIDNINIIGEIEDLEECKCCLFKSLLNKTNQICPVCLWDNEGSDFLKDSLAVSNINGLSLSEARENFKRIGVMSENMLDYLLEDNKEKYLSNDR